MTEENKENTQPAPKRKPKAVKKTEPEYPLYPGLDQAEKGKTYRTMTGSLITHG